MEEDKTKEKDIPANIWVPPKTRQDKTISRQEDKGKSTQENTAQEFTNRQKEYTIATRHNHCNKTITRQDIVSHKTRQGNRARRQGQL
jgi:hypothetical protein